jgi:penicillin-binding protein 1C
LEEYLNRVDFGNLNIGVVAAADFYFGKPLGDLTAAEAAFIAGLPKNPTRLNPHRSLSATQSRQRTVLRRMRDNGWLGAEAYARAVAEPAKLNPPDRVFHAPHFVDFALRRFASPCAPRRTTLDLDLNRVIERKLREELRGLRDRSVRNGSVVVIDNASGGVLALVGSEDYFAPGEGQVNGAWSARSAGSTLKPFTYLIALERGATPATIYADVPTEFSTSAGIYRVENYAKRCSGPVSLRQALACSLNIPAVRALNEIGGPSVLHRRLLDWGFTSIDRLPDRYGLGLTIGNAEVRLLELTNAYASLARLGEYRPWRIFLDQPAESSRQSADARTCWQIADILSDNAARIPAFGANSALRFDFPVACKTGTSTDYRDNWAMGYTPEFTVGVWIGNFDGSAMRGVSGVTGAAPVLHAVFEHLHERFGTSWYAPPPGLVECDIHAWTGHRVAQARSESRRERFLAEHLPPMESPEDYDSSGRVKLPVEYAAWLADGGDAFAQRAAVNAAPGALQIMEPKSGTVFVLDPDLPGSQRVRLVAAGGSAIEWRCESLNWHARGAQTETVLVEGEHRVEAIDSSTGMRAATWIRVKSL